MLNLLNRLLRRPAPETPEQEAETLPVCSADAAVKPVRKKIQKMGYALETIEERLDQVLDLLSDIKAGPRHETQTASQGLSGEQLHALVGLSDNIFHALQKADPAGRETLAILHEQACRLLASFDIQPVSSTQVRFDDRVHEAREVVSMQDVPDLQVVNILRPGYLMGGRLLRPAWVTVSRQNIQ